MRNSRYIYEPYNNGKGRHTCPNCRKSKKFKRYIDVLGVVQFPDYVGTCERINACGYHYSWWDYFQEKPNEKPKFNSVDFTALQFRKEEELPISYIDETIFKQSLRGYRNNDFVSLLVRTFGNDTAIRLINMYKIGTSSKHNGVVFWQIDRWERIRTGKIMYYDLSTGKRKVYTNWVHCVLKLPKFNLRTCLFGEHLLDTNKGKPIAIVESEKTAIIMTVLQPLYLWIACGGASNLTLKMLQNIKDREIIAYPDVGFYSKWKVQASFLNDNGFCIVVSDYIENIATPEQKGDDIADFYLRFGEPYSVESEQKHYTPQEIQLAKMVENNANLRDLKQLFRCKIIYDNTLMSF